MLLTTWILFRRKSFMFTECDTTQQDTWMMEVKLADTAHVTAVWMKSEKTGVYASKILTFFSLLYLWYRKNPYFISGKGFCLVIFLKKYMLFSCDVLHGGCTQKIFWYSSGLNCSDSKYSPLIITSFIVELLLLKLFRKFSLNFTSWHLMLLCPVQQYIGKMFLPFSKVVCINCVSGM